MKFLLFFLLGCLSTSAYTQTINALELPQTKHFIDSMVTQHGFVRSELEYLFRHTELTIKKPSKTTVNIQKKPYKPITWTKYKSLFLTPKRIEDGAKFIQKHQKDFNKAYEQYGVSPYIIAAILGIETNYGAFLGKYPTLQTLSSLSFGQNRRQSFYKKELESFLLMVRKNRMQPFTIKGSHAGAIGIAQFISSSYNYYAVDFDDDGEVNLFEATDSIGSVSNYLYKHYWQRHSQFVTSVDENPDASTRTNKPKKTAKKWREIGVFIDKNIADDIKLSFIKIPTDEGYEHFLTFWNFYVITRYNHNNMYALAVVELANAIKQKILSNQ